MIDLHELFSKCFKADDFLDVTPASLMHLTDAELDKYKAVFLNRYVDKLNYIRTECSPDEGNMERDWLHIYNYLGCVIGATKSYKALAKSGGTWGLNLPQ